jgi:phage baseplate assembly protein W
MAAKPVGAGLDRWTGRPIAGWGHVVLSLEAIFSTPFGSRVMRRWIGSLVPNLLGENLVPETLLNFFTALFAALTFEPRFALTRIAVLSEADELRTGRLRLELQGVYRPRAHLGDFTVDRPRRIILFANEDGLVTIENPL